jgi:ABC-type sulfate transport system permease component
VILVYNPKVASILIFDRFTLYGLPAAVPVAALLLIVALVVFILLRWLEPRRAAR